LANIASRYVLRHAQKVARQTTGPWDDAVIEALKRPIPIMILTIGISTAAKMISKHYDYDFLTI
jgi:MscS family membrane protein